MAHESEGDFILKRNTLPSFILLILLAASLIFPAGAWAESGSRAGEAARGAGYVPPEASFIGVNDYDYNKESKKRGLLQTQAALPGSFDYRAENPEVLTTVRDQGVYGTCWAFASLTAATASLVKKGETSDAVQLSPLHLAYNAYPGSDNPLDEGGHEWMALGSMSKRHDPAYEKDYPYSFAASYLRGSRSFSDEELASSNYFIDELLAFPNPNRNGSLDAAAMRTIKTAVMEKGPLTIAYRSVESGYKSSTNAFYQKATDANHMVTIVGWNDAFSQSDFAVQPPGKGAFICMNSWGSSWGESGFFYLSYYDPSISNISYFGLAATADYDDVAYDDEGGYGKAVYYEQNKAGMANFLRLPGDSEKKSLSAVSVILLSPGMSYTISAYKNPDKYISGARSSKPVLTPESGVKLDLNGDAPGTDIAGSQLYAGYYTIPVQGKHVIGADDTIAVVVRVTSSTGYAYIPLDEYDGSDGSGSYREGMFTAGDSPTGWEGYDSDMDVCIKAFTDDPGEPEGISVAGDAKTQYAMGDPLDLSDGMCEIAYSEGGTETIPLDSPDVEVAGYDNMSPGQQTLTVRHKATGLTAAYRVNVLPKYFSVAFMDGSVTLSAEEVLYGAAATEPQAPSKEGHTFAGWFRDSAFAATFSFDEPVSENRIAYAKFDVNPRVGTPSEPNAPNVTPSAPDTPSAPNTPDEESSDDPSAPAASPASDGPAVVPPAPNAPNAPNVIPTAPNQPNVTPTAPTAPAAVSAPNFTEDEDDSMEDETDETKAPPVKLKSPTLKLKSGKKNIAAKWLALPSVSGYEIRIATNQKFTKGVKSYDIKKQTTATITIRKLKAGKEYYLKIRSFAVKDGKKRYSDWSGIKSASARS
jgi:uncharacterized repeat protein (TIGR02543 family)